MTGAKWDEEQKHQSYLQRHHKGHQGTGCARWCRSLNKVAKESLLWSQLVSRLGVALVLNQATSGILAGPGVHTLPAELIITHPAMPMPRVGIKVTQLSTGAHC